MNVKKNVFMGCDADFDEAELVIYGAPFDSTTSFRPGTRFAPNVLRADSLGFETYSPYQDRDITELRICDAGDLFAPLGNAEEMLDLVRQQSDWILDAGKMPIMVGGEHTLTQGVVASLVKRFPNLHIFHFDAHTDLRDVFLGQELSHANVIKKAWRLMGEEKADGRIHAFGIRSGDREEFLFGREHLDYHCFSLDGVHESVQRVLEEDPETPVYLTLDLDVLDPSVLPGTGTPEPGGASFMELLNALLEMKPLRFVGFDVVELSPPYDPTGSSNAACWKLLRELFLIATARGQGKA